MVEKIVATRRENAAKNLPSTICESFTGEVHISSIVPERFSSEIERMVTAGIKKIKMSGVSEKMFRIDASLTRKSSEPKNQPVMSRKWK